MHWSYKKPSVIARSSTKVKYNVLACVATKVIWRQALLEELHITSLSVLVLWCDNLSIVALAANPVLHARIKHVKLDIYFIREKILVNVLLCGISLYVSN